MVTCLHPLAGIQSKPLGHVCRYSRSANTRKRETCAKGFFIGLTMKITDIKGQRFGRLFVVRFAESTGSARWLCICDCGNEVIKDGRLLRSGSTQSCGCIHRERMSAIGKKYNENKKIKVDHAQNLREMFDGMKKRCRNKNSKSWKDYGGRGIKVCDEWLKDSRAFYFWASSNGYAPGLTIERNDVDGNYEPGNCRFIPKSEQSKNTTRTAYIEFNGVRMTRMQWAEKTGISAKILASRAQHGWSVERMLTQPLRGFK